VLDLAKEVPKSVTVGTTVGYFAGYLLLSTNPIGWAALIVVGGGLAASHTVRARLKAFKQRDRTQLRNEVSWVLTPYVDDCLSELEASTRNALLLTEQALEEAFDQRLRQEQERLAQSIDALRAARRRTQEEADARGAELRAPLARLDRLRDDADRLARAARAVEAPALPAGPS
jgi:DNA anti-recombination protein RmuC